MGNTPGVEATVESILAQAPPAEKVPEETPVKSAPEEGKEPVAPTKPEEKTVEKAEAESEGDKGEDGRKAFEEELVSILPEDQQQALSQLSPEDQVERLKWMKTIYRSQSRSNTELGTLRKAVSALKDAGVTNEDLLTLMQSKRGGAPKETPKTATSATEIPTKRGFRRYDEEVIDDPKERESLRLGRQAIREEMEDILNERLDKDLKPLREKLDVSERQQQNHRAQTLGQEIDALEDKLGWPGSVVESYRDRIRQAGLVLPNLDAETLFYRIAEAKDIRLVAVKRAASEPEKEKSSQPAAPVIKKPAQGDVVRNSRGIASVMKTLDAIVRPGR